MREGSSLIAVRNKKLLLVVERGEDIWTLPGGKRETGETPKECLIRESDEELDGAIPENIRRFMIFRGMSKKGLYRVKMTVFFGNISGKVKPGREMSKVEWMTRVKIRKTKISAMTGKIVRVLVRKKLI